MIKQALIKTYKRKATKFDSYSNDKKLRLKKASSVYIPRVKKLVHNYNITQGSDSKR